MFKFYALLLTVLVVLPSFTWAQGTGGSKSLLRVQTASTLQPRRLDFRSNTRFFTKLGDFIGATKPKNFTAVNFWSVQGNTMLSYGITDHFDATFKVNVYQDVHKATNEANTPGDVALDLKAGSFGGAGSRFQFGGMFSMILPSGESHNYPFEEYAPDAVQFGLTGLISYYNDPFLMDRSYSFHVSAGWHYYNDAGKTLFDTTESIAKSGEIQAGNNASSFKYGLGFSYPTELFDLNLEFWGNAFITQPDSFVFSRESFAYITPSIRFKPRWWVNFDLGLDVRVSNDTEESKVSFSGAGLNLPNYASWRMTLGLNLVLNGGDYRFKGGIGEQGDVKNKVNFYDRLLHERERARSIEEELRRLKREREQAEKELEELRQLLEEEK